MASNLVMNGTTFDGTPLSPAHPFKPNTLELVDAKIGKTIVAYNGKRRFVSRSAQKKTWRIGWELANETTRAAVRTLAALGTTWAFVNQLGTSYTVQTEQDDYSEDYATTDATGNLYYHLKLIVREA